jgi:molecular chaperone Hsp33
MDIVQRFLFEELDIRGSVVQLGPAWRALRNVHAYTPETRALLGELAAVTTLIGSNLKTPGRLRFQLQGQGPISLLMMDCDEQLRLRGMARGAIATSATEAIATSAAVSPAPTFSIHDLLGDGQLLLTLQPANAAPYQSLVPNDGDSIAEIFEHYLTQSEQQPSRLWLMADAHHACGLFLQKLPDADLRDDDGWRRITHLATTLQPAELTLPPENLLNRLFHDETIRLFSPRSVTWHCPRDEEKIRNLLLTMGRDEVAEILAERGEIAITDEICGHEYRFGPAILDELFPPARLLH